MSRLNWVKQEIHPKVFGLNSGVHFIMGNENVYIVLDVGIIVL